MKVITHRFSYILCSVYFVSYFLSGCQVVDNGFQKSDSKSAAVAYTALAAEYIRQNNLDVAKKQAEKALKVNRYHAPALNMMGVILQRDGGKENVRKAEGFFKRAISSDRNYVQARNNYGVYLSEVKRYKEAITQFEIAGAKLGYEGRVAALENLGRTALKIDDEATAERAFRQALSMRTNSVVSRIELIGILIKRREYKSAQPIYQDYLNIIGGAKQGPRSVLQGVMIASAMNDVLEFKRLYSILKEDYPNSSEMQTFIRLFPME